MAKGDVSKVRDSVLSGVAPAVLMPFSLCLGVPLHSPSTSCDAGGKFKTNKTLGRTQADGEDAKGDRIGDMGWNSLLARERGKVSICSGGFGETYGLHACLPLVWQTTATNQSEHRDLHGAS